MQLSTVVIDYMSNTLSFQQPSVKVSTLKLRKPEVGDERVHAESEVQQNVKCHLMTPSQLRKSLRRGNVMDMCLVHVEHQVDNFHLDDRLNALSNKETMDPFAKAVPGTTPAELRLRAVLIANSSLFVEDLPDGLPPQRVPREVIPLETDGNKPVVPPNRPMFRYSPIEQAEMHKQVMALLKKGVLEVSSSPFSAPVLFVKKKSGDLRMCVDYRALNKLTVKNRYPLPRIDDLLDRLQGGTVFSSLDLTSAYHQIRLTSDDVPKTAFKTPFGLFQYRVMPFGLTNAPSVFMAAINDVLHDLPFCVVYLDDILIFSKGADEHVKHVEMVLQRLKQHQYFAKLSKCEFFKKEVHFLGHVVSAEGVKPDPKKLAVVKDWPRPYTVAEVRSFLGFANYFRKFIFDYSRMAAPLTTLVRGGISRRKGHSTYVEWTPKCQSAFDALKHALTSAPCLALPDFSRPFEVVCPPIEVVTDASNYALGAILMHDGKPIAFESRKLTSVEVNYTTTEKELLAVVHALKLWRCYLEGSKFTVVTDHNPLTFFHSQPLLSRRQARWSEFMQMFNFNWEYRPGAGNPADPLSRLMVHNQ
jgi:hypothetical protein